MAQKESKKIQLTVRLRSDEKRDALEPLDVGRRDMPRALVVPLPVRVQRVELHAPPGVRHPEPTPASPPIGSLARRGQVSPRPRRAHRGRGGPGGGRTRLLRVHLLLLHVPLHSRSLRRHRGLAPLNKYAQDEPLQRDYASPRLHYY